MLERPLGSVLLLTLLFLAAGCQTPERRRVIERMDKLQAENSAAKSRGDADVAQARMDAAKQRLDDVRVIEALNQRVEALGKEVQTLKGQPRVEAPKDPKPTEPAPAEVPNPDIERIRAESRAAWEKAQEDRAKAQAQSEAARLAAEAAQKQPAPGKKPEDFKDRKLPLTKFIDANGKLVDLTQFLGKKPVVLVVMKGFYSQGICVYCTKQTSGLARTAPAFRDANAEVLVVYPGREDQINAFVASVRDYENSNDPRFRLPFNVLLDVNQDAVRALHISGDLAHPTSFILDKDGVVRYQYIGKTLADRPGAEDLLKEVKKLGETRP